MSRWKRQAAPSGRSWEGAQRCAALPLAWQSGGSQRRNRAISEWAIGQDALTSRDLIVGRTWAAPS